MKISHIFKFLYFFVLILTFGCSTKFVVKSEPPEANVYFLDVKTGEKKSIGKTPLEMPAEDVKKAVENMPTAGEFYTVVVEKNGFETQTFSLPTAQYTTLVTALDVKLKEGNVQRELKLAKSILDQMFLAQKFALKNQFERAHIELDKIIEQFPSFSKALSMRASVYFAQKNYPESLRWFEESLRLEPTSEESIKMAAKLRAMPGVAAKAALPAPTRNISATTQGAVDKSQSSGEKK